MQLNKYIKCNTGSIEDMIDAFETRIMELENGIISNSQINQAEITAADTIYEEAIRYNNYEEFLNAYSDFYDSEEDIESEIWSVDDELYRYNADMYQCPVYWRDDYETPIIDIGGEYYHVDFRGMSTRFTPVTDDPEYIASLGLPSAL